MTAQKATLCAGSNCENLVPQRTGRGRPSIYCNPACRPEPIKQRRARIDVVIEHEPTVNGERPAGRVWSVHLQRGDRRVVIATELGRPSAENLAAQINELLIQRGSSTTGGDTN